MVLIIRDGLRISVGTRNKLNIKKKKYFGYYTQWLEDGIYVVINVGVEISLEGIQTIQSHHKKNK